MDSIVKKYNSFALPQYRKHISSIKTETLLRIKEKLDNRYYNTGEPVIDDVRYDILVDLLAERGAKLQVGCKLREADNKTRLPFYLGGMDKIKMGEDSKLSTWLGNNPSSSYVASDKLNGVSCLVVYTCDGTINLYTRGDCMEGADVSYLAPMISSIPKKMKPIAVRGEFIISQEDYTSKHTDKKNCLSTIIGLINSKTLRQGVGDLKFIAYEIVDDKPGKTPEENFQTLKKLGFLTARYEVEISLSAKSLSDALLRRKEDSPYEIDGLVVQSNLPYNRHNLAPSGNPDYAFAFKMLIEVAEVSVVDVEWNVSRYGVIKPRVKVIGLDGKPVKLTGITIQYSSGFDASYIRDNKINTGSRLLITRSGDIIPYIVQVLTQSESPRMPDCEYTWNESGVDIIAKDPGRDMLVQKLTYFFTTLGVKHVNEGLVARFVDSGLHTVPSILKASKEDLLKIPGFKGRLAGKIHDSIHNMPEVDVSVLMCASGVFESGLGPKKAKLITDQLDVLKDTVTVDKLTAIDGFSTKTAEKVVSGIDAFREFVKAILPFIKLKEKEEKVSNSLAGQKFVFTGFRDPELKEAIEKNGGTVTDTVSSKTSMLIVSKIEESSTKVTKARQLGVKIIQRSEFKF